MNKKYLSIFCIFFWYEAINAFDIKPSRATLESNVGEMQVEMKMLEDGTWKLTSLLDGGSIVRREESEVFKLIDNQIHPINYRFNQRILFRKYKASADFDWQDNEVSFVENKDKGKINFPIGFLDLVLPLFNYDLILESLMKKKFQTKLLMMFTGKVL